MACSAYQLTGFRGFSGMPSFAEWLFDAIINDKKIILFDDYYTSTIDANSLAKTLFDLIDLKFYGLLNIASREVSSKRKFAELLAKKMDIKTSNMAIGSVKKQSPTRANSLGLDVSKAEQVLGYQMPVLKNVIESLIVEYENAVC